MAGRRRAHPRRGRAGALRRFGAKGYGNLTELALLQRQVAEALDRPLGELRLIVESAHIYDTERAEMAGIVADRGEARPA